jgi:3-oxoacyl-[acyl-carrier protein] reductase
MDLSLRGRRAVITGASRGVGAAIARSLAAEGVSVVVNYNSSRREAEELVAEIQRAGGSALAIRADMGVEADCIRLVEETVGALGGLDILVNNAAVWYGNWVQDISLSEWNRTLDVNLTAAFVMTREFLKRAMAAGGGGRILNITSQAAFNGSTTGHAHYAVSKAGLVALTVSTAREVAKYGMTANAVALGMVDTDLVRGAVDADPEYYLKRIPIGRMATGEDIAKIVTFLVSDAAAYITGATIDATGGMLMR